MSDLRRLTRRYVQHLVAPPEQEWERALNHYLRTGERLGNY